MSYGEPLPQILLGLMLNAFGSVVLLVWSALTSVLGVTRKAQLEPIFGGSHSYIRILCRCSICILL
jgi:hypothetical protein